MPSVLHTVGFIARRALTFHSLTEHVHLAHCVAAARVLGEAKQSAALESFGHERSVFLLDSRAKNYNLQLRNSMFR